MLEYVLRVLGVVLGRRAAGWGLGCYEKPEPEPQREPGQLREALGKQKHCSCGVREAALLQVVFGSSA